MKAVVNTRTKDAAKLCPVPCFECKENATCIGFAPKIQNINLQYYLSNNYLDTT